MKKLFWNWDHSTNWVGHQQGEQNTGVGNYYTKPSSCFEQDAKRMIDYAARNGIDAVGFVGLLRDAHGGTPTAQRICSYGQDKGVIVYLIAGLYAYGGLYYEGNNHLSLNRFLSLNPECRAIGLDARPQYVQFAHPHGYKRQPGACPSNPQVRNFTLDALDYLFQEIPTLGGIQLETGDSAVCLCDRCRERRKAMQGGEKGYPFYSLSDMADIYPEAASVVLSRRPQAWVLCENYLHWLNNPVYRDPENPCIKRLAKMPDQVFMQWSDGRLKNVNWTVEDKLPAPLRKFHHVMRCHHGSQWAQGRATIAVEGIQKQCRLTHASGMDSVSIFGEVSPFHTNAEINYLALCYFGDHPENSVEEFAEHVLAEKLGGKESALIYLEFAKYSVENREKIPDAVKAIARIVPAFKDYHTLRRWNWLASYLNSWCFEFLQSLESRGPKELNIDFL